MFSNFNQQAAFPQSPYNYGYSSYQGYSPYQQAAPQPQQQMQALAQGQNTYFYVNGKEGAKAFIVAPNSSAMLMDSDSNAFYIKSANQQGQATLKKFTFREENEDGPVASVTDNIVTKEDLTAFEQKVMARLDELMPISGKEEGKK